MSRRSVRATPAILALLALAGATLAAAQPAADPFYLSLLREGRTSLARGDAAGAAKELRVACFGLLDQPPLLGECLVRLALAQGAMGDREAFGETFDRIETIEERFQAYTQAALSPEERESFEDRALDWIAPEILRTLPSFAPRLARRAEESLAKLPPRERQKELERRAAAEPGNPRWRVLLAEEAVARERWDEALERLKGIDGAAEAGRAGCLTGLALAKLERCAEALPPLAACAATRLNAELAEARLGCHVERKSLDEGRAFAATLDPKVASLPAIQKLREKLSPKEKAQQAASTASEPAPAREAKPAPDPVAKKPAAKTPSPAKSTPAATNDSPATPSPKTPSPPRESVAREPAKPSAEEEKAIRDGRELLRSAQKREELLRGLDALRAVSDRHPENAQLALLIGEIAYRGGQWRVGASSFRRAAPRGPADPTLRFYMAVCLYEAGERSAAAEIAATGLEKLQRTPFVESYLQKIGSTLP